MKTKVGVAFIAPESGAVGEPPRSQERFDKKEDLVKDKLKEMYPEIDFSYHEIKTLEDVSNFLDEEKTSTGYLVFVLNSIGGLLRPILQSGEPTILINETYGGSGEYLLEYSRALKKEYPVIGVSAREIASDKALKDVELLEVVGKLKSSRSLFIVSPGTEQLVEAEYPLSVDLWSSIQSINNKTGINSLFLNSKEFVENYYSEVDDEKAEDLKNKWMDNAEEVREEKTEGIKNSAKLYFALKEAVKDYDVDSIAVDCIVLFRNEFLDAWPCLSFMELSKDEDIVPVCEADPYSNVSLLIMSYLADLPGFINDPSPDEFSDEVVYYHCYAPINFCGSSKGESDYSIKHAHLDGKHASVYTELPEEGEITVVGLDPDNEVMTLHTAEALANEDSEYACSTKLVGKTDTKALAENWRPRSGWHRVAFYGNWIEELEKIAKLLGMDTEREDIK